MVCHAYVEGDALVVVVEKAYSHMVCGHYVVTFLNCRPTFEWYMAMLVVNYIF